MLFCVTGISFRTAPIEIRERLSFHESEIPDALKLLCAKEDVAECVILSTCNRVEIYSILRQPRVRLIGDFIRDFHKFSVDLDGLMYSHTGIDAIRHLCVVASGLDSMVLGEPQIFGQVKDAYARAVSGGAARGIADHLFPQVFSLVKKVRSRTKVGERNVSVSYTAVRLAESIFKRLEDKRVMILGAGEMGELTLRNMISSGVSNVVVANRTFQRAVELAERFKGVPIMLHEINEYLPKADILISSLSVPEFIIKRSDLEPVMASRGGDPIFLVDISVPRSLDPEISTLENIHLYNIDDLKAVVDSNAEARQQEAQHALSIIEERIVPILDYMNSADIAPTLVSIRAKAEEIRLDDLARIAETMPMTDRTVLDSITRSIVNKILHHLELKLREFSTSMKSDKETDLIFGTHSRIAPPRRSPEKSSII